MEVPTPDNFSPTPPLPIDMKSPLVLPFYNEYKGFIYTMCYIWPVSLLFGLVSNIVNVVVFLKAGAKDNVTILLIALSISDFIYLILISPTVCAFIIDNLVKPPSWPFDKFLLMYLLYWPAHTFYDLSTYISVFLGVMRCACVAMPLKFKAVFTKSRTIKWILILIFLAVGLRIPILTVNRIGWRTDPTKNTSVPYLNAVNDKEMSEILDILNRGIVIIVSYITMIICVVILSYKLYQASKIRHFYANAEHKPPNKASVKSHQGLSTKDLLVVQSVTLVCTIFVLAQLPYFITAVIRLTFPEFAGTTETGLVFLFGIFTNVAKTCSYINASVNIFVYYHYNSKYRFVVRSLLLEKQTVQEQKLSTKTSDIN